MKKSFKRGDHVEWNSEAGRVRGIITKKVTSDVNFKGYVHHASKPEPQSIRNRGGQMKLVNLNKRVQDLLVMTNLHKIFDIHDDEAGAIKSFGSQLASGAVS